MSTRFIGVGLVCGILLALVVNQIQAVAQIKITYPVNRLVVQRDTGNKAIVQIAGSYAQPLNTIEARVVSRTLAQGGTQGTTTSWTVIQTNPTNGQFNGKLTVKGGWYKVLVRGISGGVVVATDSVERFGVGEVFAIMGHSNAQGSGCTINGVNQCPSLGGASDERVVVTPIPVPENEPTYYQYLTTASTRYLPGMSFRQLLPDSGFAPFAHMPWLWSRMGDALVQRINVPVLLYNAGFGGTNMQQTYWAAYDIPFSHSFVNYNIRMPYANIRNTMNLYIPSTGIRAFLVQHGENDRANPTDSTVKYYKKVFEKIRTEANLPNLAFIVSISSFGGTRYDNVRAAQFQIINTPSFLSFLGPDLDNISSVEDRPDGIHYSPAGQVKAGNAWANAITDEYLRNVLSMPAEQQPLVSIACGPPNQLRLTQPSGYQSIWNTGSEVSSLTVGTGTYYARISTPQNKVYFPPAIAVPANVKPATPTITTDNGGGFSICSSSGIRLISSFSGPNQWSTGATSTSINATTAGTYVLQAKNPVYGCLSDPFPRSVSLSPTDLRISMQTSKRVVALNDTVSVWITVENRSVCDAQTFSVRSRLPQSMAFVSSSQSLNATNNVVNGNYASLAGGNVVSRRYIGRLQAEASYVVMASLSSASNPLVGVTLNNGTANGETDETQVEIHTRGDTLGVRNVSPNPEQVVLPPVQPNQPAPDPAKADLSLYMQTNTVAVKLNQPFSVTLTVQNRGGLTATNVVLNNLLPSGLQFVSSSSGMTVNGSNVRGTISQLPVGQSATITFMAQATSSGTFINRAQVQSASQSDPDSTPGNGYTNGEDDQASVSLRTN
ncbi:hypothetical protein GCM10028805_02670 [Spirosoma harenae]